MWTTKSHYLPPFFKLKEKPISYLLMEEASHPLRILPEDHLNLAPRCVLCVYFSTGEHTTSFQLQQNTEIRISAALNDFQSNSLLNKRESH